MSSYLTNLRDSLFSSTTYFYGAIFVATLSWIVYNVNLFMGTLSYVCLYCASVNTISSIPGIMNDDTILGTQPAVLQF